MTDGYMVDHAVLRSIAEDLRSAGSNVDQAGNSIPRPPDAGDATAAITGILAHLAANAGNLVTGLAGAAGDVDGASTTYRSSDEESQQRFAGELRGL